MQHCAIPCCLILCDLGTGEGDVEDAEKLLQPYLKKYPKVLNHHIQNTVMQD